jgi:hypothetical protein
VAGGGGNLGGVMPIAGGLGRVAGAQRVPGELAWVKPGGTGAFLDDQCYGLGSEGALTAPVRVTRRKTGPAVSAAVSIQARSVRTGRGRGGSA